MCSFWGNNITPPISYSYFNRHPAAATALLYINLFTVERNINEYYK